MPRAKDGERRRCATACLTCKRRKEKCDGLSPCAPCMKRKIPNTCTYLSGAATTATFPNQHTDQASCHDPLTDNAELEQNVSSEMQDLTETVSAGQAASKISAPVPKLSRMLKDPNGKFIYIGDSASLSFLQTIRAIVNTTTGFCNFTSDPVRHHFIETTSIMENSRVHPDESALDIYNALDLMRHFFVAVSGVLHLFDSPEIIESIQAWAGSPKKSQFPNTPIFYLVLAIGAQARVRDDEDDYVAEQYYRLGRQHALAGLMDDPSIMTVQAFCMTTWYLVVACRRNGALMNLGLAVQAAYALGIHRHEANIVFDKDMALSREKAWRTLRVCDLYLSASMGRPSITSNVDSNIPFRSPIRSHDRTDSFFGDRWSSATSRICRIFERILSEVYSKKVVSLELVADISKQHREWTMELGETLKVDGWPEPGEKGVPVSDLKGILGSAVVRSGYYYSVILLTRPFLTFRVKSYNKNRRQMPDQDQQNLDVNTYADACVSSAIGCIGLVHSVVFIENMPKRLPLIVNNVFMAALSIGLAYFGDYDCRGWALENTLIRAVAILGHFGLHSPQSARYKQIIEFLRDAIGKYKFQRDDEMSYTRTKHINDVFGILPAISEGASRPITQAAEAFELNNVFSLSTSSTALYGNAFVTTPTHGSYQAFGTIQQSSLITTSGRLAPQPADPDRSGGLEDYDDKENFDLLFNGLSNDGFSNFVFGDELPLFSVMNDYQLE